MSGLPILKSYLEAIALLMFKTAFQNYSKDLNELSKERRATNPNRLRVTHTKFLTRLSQDSYPRIRISQRFLGRTTSQSQGTNQLSQPRRRMESQYWERAERSIHHLWSILETPRQVIDPSKRHKDSRTSQDKAQITKLFPEKLLDQIHAAIAKIEELSGL